VATRFCNPYRGYGLAAGLDSQVMNSLRLWIQLALFSPQVYCFLPHNLSGEKEEVTW
jgi:hypothetical protein